MSKRFETAYPCDCGGTLNANFICLDCGERRPHNLTELFDSYRPYDYDDVPEMVEKYGRRALVDG